MAKGSTLPVLLKSPRILLIGGGEVALRKAQVLNDNQAEYSVLAIEFLRDFKPYKPKEVILKKLEIEDLAGYSIIIDATGSEEVRNLLLEEKKRRPILVNAVDDPDFCDFYFSAILNRPPIKVSVSTDGDSPISSAIIRDKIAQFLPVQLSEIVASFGKARKTKEYSVGAIKESLKKEFTRVYLIGCGLGDPELLTIRAYRVIQSAEIALIDHLVPETIRSLLPESCERIDVGKQKSKHSKSQEEINQLLGEMSEKGGVIVRLKSGDPFIFGRGAEEALFLAEKGVNVEVIPGISSFYGAPHCAGIPLTARGYSTEFSVVSAHLANNLLNLDWVELLKIPNHTVVALMGLSQASAIRDKAKELGVSGELPIAVVSNASHETQSVIISNLDKFPEETKTAPFPAVLVFGDVVKLYGRLPHWVSFYP